MCSVCSVCYCINCILMACLVIDTAFPGLKPVFGLALHAYIAVVCEVTQHGGQQLDACFLAPKSCANKHLCMLVRLFRAGIGTPSNTAVCMWLFGLPCFRVQQEHCKQRMLCQHINLANCNGLLQYGTPACYMTIYSV
eukprot:GHRR01019429.1.p2 GENE.GHRR01019429.1~~GHRR01019429.1.p2  ORF type:complete len:138 (+),score=10.95 GHRR01019429.1:2179-2592(+)